VKISFRDRKLEKLANDYRKCQKESGQWSCDLDQPYRLVFEPQEKPIPTDKSGKYIWLEIKAVEIIEIADYH